MNIDGIKNKKTIIGIENNSIIEDIRREFNYQIKILNTSNSRGTQILKTIDFSIYFSGVGKSGNIAKHCCELLKSISLKTNYLDILNSRLGDRVLKKIF